jgi:uncharacterized protein (DUF433 family)
MSETVGDYSGSLSDELNIANMTQANAAKQAADLAAANALYNTPGALGPDDSPITVGKGNNFNTDDILAYNNPAGNSSLSNYTPTGSLPSGFDLSALTKFLGDNKGLITAGGAALGLMGANNAQTTPTGYQGGIPALTATRNMIAAPPTSGYRPGQGGINYGGDVTYTRTPGVDPWVNLSGNSAFDASGVNSVYNNSNLFALNSLYNTSNAASQAAAAAAAKAAADLAAAQKAGNAAAIAAAQKAAADAAAAAKAAADKAAADRAAAAKAAADKAAADAAAKAAADAAAKAAADAKAKVNVGSTGYQAAIKAGLTPAQYLNSINQWLIDNPRASKTQIDDAMKTFGVSQTDLQEALRTTNFSDYTKFGLTHGQGLQELNMMISNWVADHPYASNKEIQDAMKAAGVNDEDIARGLNGLSASAGKEYAIIHDMGLDKLYQNILDYQAAGHSPAEIAAALQATGLEQRDINNANKYATAQGYVANPNSAAATQNFLPPTTTNLGSVANKVADIIGGTKNDAQAPAGLDTGNSIYQYFADPATQAALASGDTRGIAEAMQSLGWSPAEVAAATGTNVADVQAAYDAALGSSESASYDPYSEAFAEGGMAKGRYLQGETDGMADELPAQIGQNQPAALSHGEFVIPADVVSHMGNGNSDAGAKKLYQMMDKIRMARTGNKKQGKKIDPDKFMPGGLAQAYANGGSVKGFAGGGTTLPTGTTGTESSLSNWGGQYVTNMLGQGQALANMPYQPYMGQLTAGESPLQTQAFGAASGLTTPAGIGEAATTAGGIATAAQGLNYTPTQFGSQYTAPAAYKPTTTDFTSDIAKSYMNPYLEQALEPQLAEARRQSQITQQQNAAKMTGAGAFGGGRQAILDAETQRALGANLANITGTGYSSAYDKAMQQFNADQARRAQEAQFGAQQGMTSAQLGAQYGLAGQQAGEQSRQFGANYGLQGLQTGLQAAQTQGNLSNLESQAGLNNLNAMLTAGGQQRGIESEGVAADKAAFEEARANPYKMVQFQQSLLSGLPLAAQSYNIAQPSALSQAMGGATTIADLLDVLTGKTAAKKV